jgi:ADP-sugar diphosphatase
LIDLTSLAYGNDFKGIYSSGGGCDEFLRFYLLKKKISKEKLKELEGKSTGLEGEFIQLKILPFSTVHKHCSDVKLLTSLFLYEKFYQK